MEKFRRASASPHIDKPILFVQNLPSAVNVQALERMFNGFLGVRVTFVEKVRNNVPSSQRAQISFQDIAEAQRAFALVNFRLIPDIQPPEKLILSRSHDASDPKPQSNPRLTKPSSPVTDVEIYRRLRRFGDIASVRFHNGIGVIVQFWTESEAKAAELGVKNASSHNFNFTLQAIDPCKLFCTHLNTDVTSNGLRGHFNRFGTVTDARVIERDGRSRGFGFVTFSKAEDALSAIQALNGSKWLSMIMIVRYYRESKPVKEETPIQLNRSESVQEPESPNVSSDATTCDNPEDAAPSDDSSTDKQKEQNQDIKETLLKNFVSFRGQLAQSMKDREVESLKGNIQTVERQRDELKEALSSKQRETEEQAATHKAEMENLRAECDCLKKQQDELKKALSGKESELEDQVASHQRETANLQAESDSSEQRYDDLEAQYNLLSKGFDSQCSTLMEEKTTIRERLRETDDLCEALRQDLQSARSKCNTLLKEKLILQVQLCETKRDLDHWQQMAKIAQSRCKILELEKNSSGEHGKARSGNASGQSRDPQAEEARRKNQLEESIRKMREIKEQEQERARSEKMRKEREEAVRKAQEEETRKQREAAQAKERARQLAWKMATDSEFERSCQRDQDLLSGRGSQWDEEFAVERFLLVLSDFEACKFSESKPLTFVNIPWPVLRPIQQRSASKSLTLTTSDITWQEVEQFFESWTASTGYTSTVSYRKVVERTHRAFHPDKWRSRKLLDTVQDQHLRQALEKAGNVVAQAMTPIWMETKT